jgi:predicted dehydrogenase
MSGGQVVEQAVHVLDLLRMLCGDVVEVDAYANSTPPGTSGADVDGATVAILKLRSGAVGTVSAACCLDWKHRAGLELHADGLSIAIHEDRVIATTAQGPVEHGLAPDDAKLAADRAFIDAVVGNGTAREGILVDYDEALRTHQLACAIAESAAHGRPVRLHD